ncbi:MAG: hypothetical protein AAFQ82_16085, partial [Myxococcota bacterium]
MPKALRPTARYFKGLPSDDEIPETKAPKERGAVKSLPDWMRGRGETPDTIEWDHLRDSGTVHDRPGEEPGILPNEQGSDRVASPLAMIADRQVRPRPSSQTRLEHDPDSASSNARHYSTALAKRDGAHEPFFKRETFEDVRTNDSNLPNVSGAVGPIRAWHARDVVTSAWIQQDKLVFDSRDDGVGGMDFVSGSGEVPSRSSDSKVPVKRLSAAEARALPPGSRVQIAVEDKELTTQGVKGTLTPLPGIGGMIANFFADVGPYAQLDLSSALRGHASIDVEAGFGSLVSVRIGVRRQQSEKDWKVKTGIGLHIDDSIIEYAAKSVQDGARSARRTSASEKRRDTSIARFVDALSKGTEDELVSMQDRADYVHRAVSPQIAEFNKRAKPFVLGAGRQEIGDQVTLYDVTFDLANPTAAAAFDRLFDVDGEYRTLDMGLLDQLTVNRTGGVTVHDNRIRGATRNSATKLFSLFGWGVDFGKTVEEATVETGTETDGSVINARKHAVRRTVTTPSTTIESVSEGRVRTVTDRADESQNTGLTLDWSYSVEDRSLGAHELAGMLTFGSIAMGCEDAQARLERHFATLDSLEREKFLGISIGRHAGKTESQLRVKLRAPAVHQLLSSLQSDEGRLALWRDLAEAFRVHHNLEEAPNWPTDGHDDSTVLAMLRRGLSVGAQGRAFVNARRSLELLAKAANNKDPVERS